MMSAAASRLLLLPANVLVFSIALSQDFQRAAFAKTPSS